MARNGIDVWRRTPGSIDESIDEECELVRIIVAGPPKAGNVWLKCILGHIYQLRPLTGRETPQRPQLHLFKEWVEAGKFPDGTILHQHCDYSPELVDLIEAAPAHVVTIIRDPYDGFVSSYFTIQNHDEKGRLGGRRTDVMAGKPLDSPEVLAYLRNGGFGNNMRRAKEWLESGRSMIVRYERIQSDPVAELRAVTDRIEPVPDERIAAAVEACSADPTVAVGGAWSKDARATKVGDSRERLSEMHLAVFREKHADVIRSLGYEVR